MFGFHFFQSFTLAIMFIESVVVLIRQTNHFRVTRALRPLFLIDTHYFRGVRRSDSDIVIRGSERQTQILISEGSEGQSQILISEGSKVRLRYCLSISEGSDSYIDIEIKGVRRSDSDNDIIIISGGSKVRLRYCY